MAVTGYGHGVSLLHVPHYVRAKTPDALTKAMLANNMKLKAHVGYFDIQYANGYWYAWFIIDIEKTLLGAR